MKRLFLRMIVTLGFAGLLAAPSCAADPAVQVASRLRELPEAGQVLETVLVADRFEVAFIPPTDWKASADSGGFHWRWAPRDRASLMSLQIQASAAA
ncbi:MAG TPA: hypothetical protein VNO52_14765, partial [Methylomirabilota bacterium]|nr:hypothetical protein [Methylomirabilota bacterium]